MNVTKKKEICYKIQQGMDILQLKNVIWIYKNTST